MGTVNVDVLGLCSRRVRGREGGIAATLETGLGGASMRGKNKTTCPDSRYLREGLV